ncbi:MAG: hypothetical protein K8R18_13250 [Parvibaculum sp.]|uniref:hypothetical protein n=1 Tax=Parvibaculum sp. TaxID=2024848 RepID=UPI0025CD503E|nr:hypothetical protein [Parvibaculum sp.]MCE9650583.1 hypothetical protein [Parvibaculum sp.]
MLFFLTAISSAAFAGEPHADCHVYRADDENSNVQRDFGRFFRKGYEFAKICGATHGPITYYIGQRPVKGTTGVCRYRERSVSRLTGMNPGHEEIYLWSGEGECPGVNVGRHGDAYMSVGDMSDEVYLALWKFWLELRTPGRNLERVFEKVPAGHVKDAFLSALRVDPAANELNLLSMGRASYGRAADGAAPNGNEPRYSILVGGLYFGWRVGGDVTDSGFEPDELGSLMF